ncbi:tyrosine-type recombinase/integrase [Nostocaceae cyanobacterium CENA357]|uniref:Tyrosine-type recombinase/integrase n=1 Tax=Atlanticothrix silvestris CENA357 TaxID=1725252 RepID=A0A8J7HJ52_9CYAN|nr:tyrosine-type recombinase/integrase [Atlanticothrix silvestris]MBH8553330.1 tyrosine-type recombinase/integrase [Atlanticothrix silvestris CENA357]
MSEDKWISVDKRNNRLVIRFWVNGLDKQFFLGTGLTDTPRNRELVRIKRDMIATDITLERFDATLTSYRFQPTRNSIIHPRSAASYSHELGDLWQRFTEFKKSLLEPTTIATRYQSTARYINKLPTQSLSRAPEIRDWLLKNTTHGMAWELLVGFSECCNWAINSGLITQNPFEKLKIKKPKRTSQDEDFRAYTLEQRDVIIKAFEQHRVHAHYANLVKFLFWTGARLGEAFALTWGDVQQNSTRIVINKSCNFLDYKKGTKNGKRRIFPTVEGSRLQQMLIAMRPAPGTYNPSELIFRSKEGKRVNSDIMQNFWNGVSSRSGDRKYFYPGVVRELESLGQLHYLKPYSTRHTFATWAIANGHTPDRVALWIGDEVSTVLKHYCHPNVVDSECPDF